MPGKKKAKKLKPYEKIQVFIDKYTELCTEYDVEMLDQVDELYGPIIIAKKGRKLPPMLQFSDEPINPKNLRPLVEAFQTGTIGISFFSFLNTESGDEGLHVLAHALTPPLEIQGIQYNSNKVTASGCRAIARGFHESKSLCILELDFNPEIGDEGVIGLCHYGHCPTLTRLSLRFDNISDDGAEAIGAWLALPECKLNELLLNGNQIGPKGAIALAKHLPENHSLRRLDLSDNVFGYDPEALDALIEGIKGCETLTGVLLQNSFEVPEGYADKFQQLVTDKPLGEFILSVKMDQMIFQNTRATAIANQKKIIKEQKAKAKAEKAAAKTQKDSPKEQPKEEEKPASTPPA